MGIDEVKATMKRALVAFLVIDALFIAAAVGLYLWLVRPRMAEVEAARDQALRANLAMTARVHAVEGRLALASGDAAGAERAAGDLVTRIDGLIARVPKNATQELSEVTNLRARAQLVADELKGDPQTARRDFELLDARLAALYPVTGGPVTK